MRNEQSLLPMVLNSMEGLSEQEINQLLAAQIPETVLEREREWGTVFREKTGRFLNLKRNFRAMHVVQVPATRNRDEIHQIYIQQREPESNSGWSEFYRVGGETLGKAWGKAMLVIHTLEVEP